MKKSHVFVIREGLNKLNGIKGAKLGEIRARIGAKIDPEIAILNKMFDNEAFDAYQRLVHETRNRYIEEPEGLQVALAKLELASKKLLDDRVKQIKEANQVLEEEIDLKLEKIPRSLLPDKETPNECLELLHSVIDYGKKEDKK